MKEISITRNEIKEIDLNPKLMDIFLKEDKNKSLARYNEYSNFEDKQNFIYEYIKQATITYQYPPNERRAVTRRLLKLMGIDDITEDFNYDPVSYDIKRRKILLVSYKNEVTEINIEDLFRDFINLNLSDYGYLNNSDTKSIIKFLSNYGFPFIFLRNNEDSWRSDCGLLLEILKNNIWYKYPFIDILTESGLLYHLEVIRRYYLFLKRVRDKAVNQRTQLDEMEIKLLSYLRSKNSFAILLPNTQTQRKKIREELSHYTLFGLVLDILINKIKAKEVRIGLESLYLIDCIYCGDDADIRRQIKWGEIFPHCQRRECIVQAKTDIKKYRFKNEYEFAKKEKAKQRIRDKRSYLRKLQKWGKISQEDFEIKMSILKN
jgi:hypothetical protein